MLPESRLRYPAAFALLLPALLGGCAAGSSLSLATAPLSYVVDDQGGHDVAARDDGTVEALAERTDGDVAGLEAVGGNALLPVSVRLNAGQGSASLNAALPVAMANVALAPVAPVPATVTAAPTGGGALVIAGPLLGTVKTNIIRPLAPAINTDSGLLATVGSALRVHH
jgi:hypothetical protein